MNKNKKKPIKLLSSIAAAATIVPLLFSSTSCSPIERESIINSLFPNVWVFLAHLIATIILICLFIWLLWKPTKNYLKAKSNFISSEIDAAKKQKIEATNELIKAQKAKEKAIEKANNITNSADTKAYEIVENAKTRAKSEATLIKQMAEADIKQEKEKIYKSAQKEITNVALTAIESVLNKKITDKQRDEFIDDILDEIKKDKLNNGK